MGDRWVRYSLTNSMPVACFFQNLRTPSIEAVRTKLVLLCARARIRKQSQQQVLETAEQAGDALCDGDVGERVAVHERLVVAVGGREVVKVQLLVLEDWAGEASGVNSSLHSDRV